MGLIETILGRVTVPSVIAFVIGALVLRHVAILLNEHIRLRRIGVRGKSLETWVPFGTFNAPYAPHTLPPTVH